MRALIVPQVLGETLVIRRWRLLVSPWSMWRHCKNRTQSTLGRGRALLHVCDKVGCSIPHVVEEVTTLERAGPRKTSTLRSPARVRSEIFGANPDVAVLLMMNFVMLVILEMILKARLQRQTP